MTQISQPGAEAQLLVIAENLLSRAGLTALLEDRGCLVLAQSDGEDLQRTIDQLDPDALVIDFGWDSEPLCNRLLELEADLPVLAIVPADEGDSLASLVAALRLFPQFALLPRDSEAGCDRRRAKRARRRLDGHRSELDRSAGGARSQRASCASSSPLTARENEVLQQLARGLTNRAIALELGITQHTVKFHVNAIMGKLDAQSRTEAVVRATQLGMIVL